MDYRAILQRYMRLIISEEGTAFLEFADPDLFIEAEVLDLEAIAREIFNDRARAKPE